MSLNYKAKRFAEPVDPGSSVAAADSARLGVLARLYCQRFVSYGS